MHTSSTGTADGQPGFGNRCCGGGGIFKRKWSLPEIGAVVGGFVLFWPLGLAALAFKYIKGEVWPGSAEMGANWKRKDWSHWQRPQGFSSWHGRGSTGNAAFDDYRQETLTRLEAERRKLEEMQREFAEHLANLRKAKDKDEFDRFMSERNAVTPKSE
jgi:Protein of unknown function (DUF2852)